MNILEEIHGDITIAGLSGQVDSVTAADLETQVMAILDRGVKSLLLDCSALAYINSAGLRVFLLAAKRLESEGGSLAFCGLAPNVRLIFETIGFDRILTLYVNREEAITGMGMERAQAA